MRLRPESEIFLGEATAVVQPADGAPEVARAPVEGGTGKLGTSWLRTMPRGLPQRIVSKYQRRFPRLCSSCIRAAPRTTPSDCTLASWTSRLVDRPDLYAARET